MKKTLALFALFILVSCASKPSWYDWHPGKSSIKYNNTGAVILKVNDMDGGNEIWLAPGTHHIPLLCKSRTFFGGHKDPLIQQLTVRPGYRYEIHAEYQNHRPKLFVEEIPHGTFGDNH